MDYKKTTWVPNETPLSAENFNNIEKGIEDAANSINDAERNISKLNLYNENFKTYNLSLLPIIKGTIQLRTDWNNFIKDLQFIWDEQITHKECILAKFTNNAILLLTIVGDNSIVEFKEPSGNSVCLYSEPEGYSEHPYTTSEYLIATYICPNADKTIFEVLRDDDSYQHSIALYFGLIQNKHNQSIKTLQEEHSKLNSLTDATEIQIDDDLNNYTTPGNYAFRLNVANVYIINTPTTERFNLKVYYSVNNNYPKRITQQLTDTNGGVFIRTTSDSGKTWTAWIQLATTDYVKEATTLKTIDQNAIFNFEILKQLDYTDVEIHFIPKQISIKSSTGSSLVPIEVHGMYAEPLSDQDMEGVIGVIYFDCYCEGSHEFPILEIWKDGSVNGVIGPYYLSGTIEAEITAFDTTLTILKIIK